MKTYRLPLLVVCLMASASLLAQSAPSAPVKPASVPPVPSPVAAPLPAAHVPAAPAPGVPDPKVGDPEAAVFAALGKAPSRVDLPNGAILLYPRGDVTLHNGVVTSLNLSSPEAMAQKQAREATAQAAQVQESARVAAMRAALLSDPAYLALSTRDRLLALDRFDREHPDSGIRADYDALMQLYRLEQGGQTKINDLEGQMAKLKDQLTQMQQQLAVANAKALQYQQDALVAQQIAANATVNAYNNAPAPATVISSVTGLPVSAVNANGSYTTLNGYSSQVGSAGVTLTAGRIVTITQVPAQNSNQPVTIVQQNPPASVTTLPALNSSQPIVIVREGQPPAPGSGITVEGTLGPDGKPLRASANAGTTTLSGNATMNQNNTAK